MVTKRNENNRHSILWKAAAVLLVLGLILSCFIGKTYAVNVSSPCSLTINVQSGFSDDTGLNNSDLVVDLYRVATAVSDSNYDTYSLTIDSDFSTLGTAVNNAQKKSTDNKAQWEEIAQRAAGIVKEKNASLSADYSGTAGTAVTNIQAGLYLVLTHNAMEDYFYEEDGVLSTIARSTEYEYHFTPQLIALPYKEGSDGIFATDGASGSWMFDLTAVTKASREVRYGSIRVIKSLSGYKPPYTATFVFDVEAEKNNENVYSNVFTLNFTEATTKGFTVEHIPVGAEVTVTEIYSGSCYTEVVSSDSSNTQTLADSQTPIEFRFQNKPTDGPGGYGILNTFTSNGQTWVWTETYKRDSANENN